MPFAIVTALAQVLVRQVPLAPVRAFPGRPGGRPCCILSRDLPPAAATNIVSPAALGVHRAGSEATGIVYTAKAGFLDLGHMRDLCDLTKYVYEELAASGGASGKSISLPEGTANIIAAVPAADWIKAARAIAYAESYGHELSSYYNPAPGLHNSSFSPEDLPSNYLGTWLAEQSDYTKGNVLYNSSVSTKLSALLTDLGAQTPAVTQAAFDKVKSRWINYTNAASIFDSTYLRRRNFTRTPWQAGHAVDVAVPAWISADDLAPMHVYFRYKCTVNGATVVNVDFPSETAKIKSDAKTKYGLTYDKP